MIDNYDDVEEKSCQNCTERVISPNCHDNCRGYKKRARRLYLQNREINTGYAHTAYSNSSKKNVRGTNG